MELAGEGLALGANGGTNLKIQESMRPTLRRKSKGSSKLDRNRKPSRSRFTEIVPNPILRDRRKGRKGSRTPSACVAEAGGGRPFVEPPARTWRSESDDPAGSEGEAIGDGCERGNRARTECHVSSFRDISEGVGVVSTVVESP
eukprot:1392385-Amorphochlora_amoeboformis.AAC.2